MLPDPEPQSDAKRRPSKQDVVIAMLIGREYTHTTKAITAYKLSEIR
jgi:hypothetical protein